MTAPEARWELTIPNWVPDRRLSLNGRHDLHWQVLKNLKNHTKAYLREALAYYPGSTKQTFAHAQVDVEFEFTQRRRRDPDNLAGLVKPLMDALVDAGVLVDDDCDHVDLTIRARATGRYATNITIVGVLSTEPARQEPLPLPKAPRRVPPKPPRA